MDSETRRSQWLKEQSFPGLWLPLAVLSMVWLAMFWFYGYLYPNQAEALMRDRVPEDILAPLMLPWRRSILVFGFTTLAIMVPFVLRVRTLLATARSLVADGQSEQ